MISYDLYSTSYGDDISVDRVHHLERHLKHPLLDHSIHIHLFQVRQVFVIIVVIDLVDIDPFS